MSDVPRPFKQVLPEYREAEDRLLALIYEKFLGSPLSGEEEALIKQIDDDMLYFDLLVLLDEKMDREEPKLKINLSYDFVPFEQVEREYLELFEELKA